jgi:hypothetical protein
MPNVIVVNTPGPQGPTGPQGPAGTSSFDTGSYVTTSSFNALTASVDSLTTQLGFTDSEVNALFIFTSSFNQFTSSYSTGSFTGSFTGSLLGSTTTSSFASTASFVNPLTQSVFISGSATFTFTSGDGLILNRDGAGNHIQPIAQPLVLYSPNSSVYQYINNSGIGINTPPSARFHVKGSGTTSSTTSFRVENANASASMVVLDNGNVGIGTNAPAYKLDVTGSTRVGDANSYGDVFVITTQGIGWSFDYQYLKIGSVFKLGLDRLQLRVNNNTAYVYNNGDSGNSSLTIMGGHNGAITQFAPIIFGSGRDASLARETMRVDNQNQRIGIGTITPSYKLDVSGSGNFTNNLTVTGSATISNILTLIPQDPLPSGVPTGSFAVSSSAPPKPYFYDGTAWNALY